MQFTFVLRGEKNPTCVISSRTTTFHHRLLCEHTLHFLRLQPPRLPQESFVFQTIFCWINTEPDPHGCTPKTLVHFLPAARERPPCRVRAHFSVVLPSNLSPSSNLRVRGWERRMALRARSRGFHPWVQSPFCSDSSEPQLTGVRCASIIWQVSRHLYKSHIVYINIQTLQVQSCSGTLASA